MSNAAVMLLVLKLIDIVALGLRIGPAAKERYDALKAEIETMVREGRDPTEEEYATMMAETESLHKAIQDA